MINIDKIISTNVNDSYIWVSRQNDGLFNIYATDNINLTRYHLATFDGAKYDIKNFSKFNELFIKTTRSKPTMLRILNTFVKNNGRDYDDDFSMSLIRFKRWVNIYIRRKSYKLKTNIFK